MSDYLPFEIQVEIIKRLPVKSLIQARSVSKAWKSLIDSSDFILDHSVRQTQPQRLLVYYRYTLRTEEDRVLDEEKYVCFVDDDTFPQHNFSPSVPLFVERLVDLTIVGSCHGLFCLHGFLYVSEDHGSVRLAVIWNPSIKKSLAVVVPYLSDWPLETGLGFGVCPGTGDPKIVKITQNRVWPDMGSLTCIPGQVMVFTLSSGVWRSPSSNLPRKSIEFKWSQVVIDGFIYWLANDRIGGAIRSRKLIMSFDLTNEEFREVSLPHSLAFNRDRHVALSISKLRESLVVIECRKFKHYGDKHGYDVWRMEDGVPISFIKLFTITPPDASIKAVLGFNKSGEPLVKTQDVYEGFMGRAALAVYEMCSKRMNGLGICGWRHSLFANYYVETLLLLNHPEFIYLF